MSFFYEINQPDDTLQMETNTLHLVFFECANPKHFNQLFAESFIISKKEEPFDIACTYKHKG